MTDCSSPYLNPKLEVSDFDSDANTPMVLCVVPGGTGATQFAVPTVYMDLAREFDGKRSIDDAVEVFLEKQHFTFSIEWLRRLIHESLIPKRILIYADNNECSVPASGKPKDGFLYLKLPLIKSRIVDSVAHRLGFLFQQRILGFGLFLFIAAHIYVYGVLLTHFDFKFDQLDVVTIFCLLFLSTLGGIFHEFGHASAAAHYGCRNVSIGWGLYLIYTVLWTNVSEAWRLPRYQRAIIDIGGVYFESFFLLLMLGSYLITNGTVFILAFVVVDLSIASTFNPFLRMDGYWLMSDIFGIANLRNQQIALTQNVINRLSGGTGETAKSTLTNKAKWTLAIYTVLTTLFMVYIIKTIFVMVVLKVATNYPNLLSQFWQDATNGMSLFAWLHALTNIAWQTLLVLGTAFMFWRLGRGTIDILWKALAPVRVENNKSAPAG